MAAINGNLGNITGGLTLLLNPTEWSMDWDMEIRDASDFAGGAWDKTLPSAQKLVGRCAGWCDHVTANNLSGASGFDKDSLSFVLTATTGRTFSFSGGFTNYTIVSKFGEVVNWTAAFESSGAVTVA